MAVRQQDFAKTKLEINLTKMKWCPKKVSEIPECASRVFEREITMEMIKPLVATDHVKTWPMEKDEDIPEFFNAPTMMQDWIAEKLIKLRIPHGVMPKDFQPKKVKILATGPRVAKFFGEDMCSTREVQLSLKLFDCGHFYMKQTLPGSGSSPHWTIFEGKWESTNSGVKLVYLLRYSWTLSQKPFVEFALEAVRADVFSRLAWEGESERQLNGSVPAIVGTEDSFWVEFVREGDKGEQAKIRWNEDCKDLPEHWPSWVRNEAPGSRAKGKELGADQTKFKPAGALEGPGLRERKAAEAAKPSPQATLKPASAQRPPAPAGAGKVVQQEDDEPMWPMLVCFGIFCLMALTFGYYTWDERS